MCEKKKYKLHNKCWFRRKNEQIRQIIRERKTLLSGLAGIIRETGSLKTFVLLMHVSYGKYLQFEAKSPKYSVKSTRIELLT